MSENINWSLNVQISGGPKISVSQTVKVEAYDKIGVTVANGADGEDIEVQPGGAGQVKALIIQSSKYSADLTYSVNAAVVNPDDRVKLDALQALIGEGAVGLLGITPPPQTLYFYNDTGEDVSIQILVGRKATTP